MTALGITAGLLLTLVQFWYTSGYQPGKQGVALNVTLALNELGVTGRMAPMHAFSGTITVENKSKTRVQVVAAQYALRGVKVDGTPIQAFADRSAVAEATKAPIPIGEMTKRTYQEVFAVDDAGLDGSYFEPDEKYAKELSFMVPDRLWGNPSVVRLAVDIILAKGSPVGPLDRVEPVSKKYAGSENAVTVEELPIRTLSLIHRITSGRQSVAVVRSRALFSTETPEEPRLFPCVGRTGFTRAGDVKDICRGGALETSLRPP